MSIPINTICVYKTETVFTWKVAYDPLKNPHTHTHIPSENLVHDIHCVDRLRCLKATTDYFCLVMFKHRQDNNLCKVVTCLQQNTY